MAEAGGGDKELDELLDNALDDFDKTSQPPPPPLSDTDKTTQPERPPGDAAKDALFTSQEKFFQELFNSELAAQATEEFEKAMKELADEEPHLVEQFQKLSEAAGKVGHRLMTHIWPCRCVSCSRRNLLLHAASGSDEESQQEFSSCLKETLSGLAKNANDLQNSSMSEEGLSKAIEDLGLDESDGEGNILPLMQNIMQNLLSKDVLYPSLKEITDKYPDWLQTNQESLPPEDYRKYHEQHLLMEKICQHFEKEEQGESEAAQFEVVMELMQQLQDLGHPPKELAGDSSPGFNFDLDGLNLSPSSATVSGEQCVVM
uniref:Peroxisomal biogenesis factor 19 n=1 Tax=Leptobrachium leishanense TaxID=445787 RepID=A0A8C5PCV4_9ANUR